MLPENQDTLMAFQSQFPLQYFRRTDGKGNRCSVATPYHRGQEPSIIFAYHIVSFAFNFIIKFVKPSEKLK